VYEEEASAEAKTKFSQSLVGKGALDDEVWKPNRKKIVDARGERG